MQSGIFQVLIFSLMVFFGLNAGPEDGRGGFAPILKKKFAAASGEVPSDENWDDEAQGEAGGGPRVGRLDVKQRGKNIEALLKQRVQDEKSGDASTSYAKYRQSLEQVGSDNVLSDLTKRLQPTLVEKLKEGVQAQRQKQLRVSTDDPEQGIKELFQAAESADLDIQEADQLVSALQSIAQEQEALAQERRKADEEKAKGIRERARKKAIEAAELKAMQQRKTLQKTETPVLQQQEPIDLPPDIPQDKVGYKIREIEQLPADKLKEKIMELSERIEQLNKLFERAKKPVTRIKINQAKKELEVVDGVFSKKFPTEYEQFSENFQVKKLKERQKVLEGKINDLKLEGAHASSQAIKQYQDEIENINKKIDEFRTVPISISPPSFEPVSDEEFVPPSEELQQPVEGLVKKEPAEPVSDEEFVPPSDELQQPLEGVVKKEPAQTSQQVEKSFVKKFIEGIKKKLGGLGELKMAQGVDALKNSTAYLEKELEGARFLALSPEKQAEISKKYTELLDKDLSAHHQDLAKTDKFKEQVNESVKSLLADINDKVKDVGQSENSLERAKALLQAERDLNVDVATKQTAVDTLKADAKQSANELLKLRAQHKLASGEERLTLQTQIKELADKHADAVAALSEANKNFKILDAAKKSISPELQSMREKATPRAEVRGRVDRMRQQGTIKSKPHEIER